MKYESSLIFVTPKRQFLTWIRTDSRFLGIRINPALPECCRLAFLALSGGQNGFPFMQEFLLLLLLSGWNYRLWRSHKGPCHLLRLCVCVMVLMRYDVKGFGAMSVLTHISYPLASADVCTPIKKFLCSRFPWENTKLRTARGPSWPMARGYLLHFCFSIITSKMALDAPLFGCLWTNLM